MRLNLVNHLLGKQRGGLWGDKLHFREAMFLALILSFDLGCEWSFGDDLASKSSPTKPLARRGGLEHNMPGGPDADPYLAMDALNLTPAFSVVAMAYPPGETNRLFWANQYGLVMVATNLVKPTSHVFLDLSAKVARGGEAGLLGLTFHPGYRTNGYFYVFYTTSMVSQQGSGLHDRLSRFKVSNHNPHVADLASEQVLINQKDPDVNHNAGDVQFGPDGYLYLSLGDGGGGSDQFNNSQRIDKDFFGGILRIDVDQRPGNIRPNPHPAIVGGYLIPRDNPFVLFRSRGSRLVENEALLDATLLLDEASAVTEFNGISVDPKKVRTEFYAVGLRNPWRFSFDALTGDFYCNDTGQNEREEVNLIRKGGNYGWAFMEGSVPGPKNASLPKGVGATLIPPIYEYDHSQGRLAIVGSLMYRGDRYPELDGSYLFSDIQGEIGRLQIENGKVVQPVQWIAFSRGVSTFGLHPGSGDILVSDGIESYIRKLVPSGLAGESQIPTTLGATGLFQDLTILSPSEGLMPYDLNLPFWSDHASKFRWFGMKDVQSSIGFTRNENWFFPPGMIWVKHFELAVRKDGETRMRRMETRLLVKTDTGVYGTTYKWADSATNAVLVGTFGETEELEVVDNGVIRVQKWRYPSRKECLGCHTREGGFALGFNTFQLNRPVDFGKGAYHQIQALRDAGYFGVPPTELEALRAYPRQDQIDWSLGSRVRAYLAANCSFCHQPGQSSPGNWDARLSVSLQQSKIVNGLLKQNFGDPEMRVVVPGKPEKSALLVRISDLGNKRMPPIGSHVVDAVATNLITSWIHQLVTHPETYDEWSAFTLNQPSVGLSTSEFDADKDGENNLVEFLTQQDPFRSEKAGRLRFQQTAQGTRFEFERIPNRIIRLEWTDTLGPSRRWRFVDVPENFPLIPARSQTVKILEPESGASQRYYRLRLLQP